jgi:hypothetical protein
VQTLESTISLYKKQIEEEKSRILEISIPTETPRSTISESSTDDPPSYTTETPMETPRSPEQSPTTSPKKSEENDLFSDMELLNKFSAKIPENFEENSTESDMDLLNKISGTTSENLLKSLDIPDLDADMDLLNKFSEPPRKTPVQDDQEFFMPPTKTKRPAFMSLFGANETKVNKSSWNSGKPVIVDFGVKEDANSKGKKGRSRKGMEDVHLIVSPYPSDSSLSTMSLFCVFDGHGGVECAAKAKKLFTDVFQNQMSKIGLSDDCREILFKTFVEVDLQLIEFEYMGSTGTAVFVWENNGKRFLQAANVGDSTAFLKRKDGQTEWLTRGNFFNLKEKTTLYLFFSTQK